VLQIDLSYKNGNYIKVLSSTQMCMEEVEDTSNNQNAQNSNWDKKSSFK
jgi:hypothetical protein